MKKILSRFRLGVPVILLALLFMLLPDSVWAQVSQGSDTLKGVAEIAGVVIELLTFLALLMLKFFGELLGTEMITGAEAMNAIRPMWVWVRNLTNILFVGVLLFLAFSNLFSSFTGDGNWTIKEKLPKLIIAMIAINFSLLGFKVVIDAVNVGTIAILGIADHRLEPDVNSLTESISGKRSWVKVDDSRYEEILLRAEPAVAVGYYPAAGDVCEGEWLSNFGPDNEANYEVCLKNPENCVLHGKNAKDEMFVCRGFTEQINDLFCREWVGWDSESRQKQARTNDECVFMIEPEKFESILTPSSEPGQNLFAAFGSTFMHLERLPALGADLKNLSSVVTNTLFSAILALAFIVALVAVFIAMVARVIVLWIALVFSPLLIGASILGVDGGKGGDIAGKIVTHLIMPLKVAAAFAVGFVMMSAMVEWHGVSTESAFFFGPALAQLGQDEYGFLWQIATIVLFWSAAFWAVEGSVAESIIKQIETGAETLAGVAARSATVDRPLFSVGTGDSKKEFSMGAMLKAPQALAYAQKGEAQEHYQAMQEAFGIKDTVYGAKIKNATINDLKTARGLALQARTTSEFLENKDKYVDRVARHVGTAGITQAFISDLKSSKSVDEVANAFKKAGGGDLSLGFTANDFGGGSNPTILNPVAVKDSGKTVNGVDISGESLAKIQQTVGASGVSALDAQSIVRASGKDAMALPVNENGVVSVKVMNANQMFDMGGLVKGLSVSDLNTKSKTGGIDIQKIYSTSDTDTQTKLLNEINSKLGGEKKAKFENGKFEEKTGE